MSLVYVEQRIGEEPAFALVAFAEVRRQFDPRFVHSAPPRSLPSTTAARPPTTLARRFCDAIRRSPSCAGRWVSSIQVENVVYEPTVATPSTSIDRCDVCSPARAPNRKQPPMLTTYVPSG